MAERRFFFEVAFHVKVFIGGDCTYFSGGGGYATSQMRSMFLALSTIYNLDIEEEVLPVAIARKKLQPEAVEVLRLRQFLGL